MEYDKATGIENKYTINQKARKGVGEGGGNEMSEEIRNNFQKGGHLTNLNWIFGLIINIL